MSKIHTTQAAGDCTGHPALAHLGRKKQNSKEPHIEVTRDCGKGGNKRLRSSGKGSIGKNVQGLNYIF